MDRHKFQMTVIFLCVLFVSLMISHSSGAGTENTWCSAPAVPKGLPGNVTCYFARDVSLIDSVTYSVDFYPTEDSTGNEILSCSRVKGGNPVCKVSPGYTFDGRISNTLTVGIKSASEENKGRFACKVMSSEFKPDLDPCNFTLADGPTPTTPNPEAASETNDSNTSIIVGVVIGVFVIVAAIVLIAVICYCRSGASPAPGIPTDKNGSGVDTSPQSYKQAKSFFERQEQGMGQTHKQLPSAASKNRDRDVDETSGLVSEPKGLLPVASPRTDREDDESSALLRAQDTDPDGQLSPPSPEKDSDKRSEGSEQEEVKEEEPDEDTNAGTLTRSIKRDPVDPENSETPDKNGSENDPGEESLSFQA